MPKFRSLSQVIDSAVKQQVSPVNFPDGSILSHQVGKFTYGQQAGSNFIEKAFTWGSSTWGIGYISFETRPD